MYLRMVRCNKIHKLLRSEFALIVYVFYISLQVVPLLSNAIGWQGGSILALETLKRVVVAGNRARDALVAQGLKVGLVEVLLGLLDWRAGGRNGLCSQMNWNESEAAIGRVLQIEVCTIS
ncbi:dnaJ homolog subfamily C GRV2-like isoform X1 [Sesamum indicum]|uniref:DnaJ homolog subfamily C GRV2-like isoform X1 n=1 Tax=Sesamum indicum TaxID=4182 RepID=A0A8M8UTB9_SESIN|nr:dnaJ homolog subfamily C GRV2-like isoform X1 [Sesamum indicum]